MTIDKAELDELAEAADRQTILQQLLTLDSCTDSSAWTIPVAVVVASRLAAAEPYMRPEERHEWERMKGLLREQTELLKGLLI